MKDPLMEFKSISMTRRHLPELVECVHRTAITKNGEPAAVLLHIDDYRSLIAEQAVARQPEIFLQAVRAHRKVQSGDLSATRVIRPASAEAESADGGDEAPAQSAG